MTTYAVTGATGPFGRHAVEELLRRGIPAADVVAVVRTPSNAADLADRGVQVREGDYSRPETLPAALAGVQRLLFVSGSEVGQRIPQHTAVVEAAQAAGVERIVYTSILNAGTTTNPLAGEHKATEQVLRASGIPTTVVRNGWYVENYTSQMGQYLATGEVLGAAGTGKVSGAPRADYAAAAAAALLADVEGDVTYELGGPAFSFDDLAAALTEVTGTAVVSRDVSVAEYVAALQQHGLDEGTATFVASLDASIAAGELETDSTDLADLLGRPVTPLAEVLRAARA